MSQRFSGGLVLKHIFQKNMYCDTGTDVRVAKSVWQYSFIKASKNFAALLPKRFPKLIQALQNSNPA